MKQPPAFNWLKALVVLTLVSCSTVALGDTGTPLIWAGMFHLMIGNGFVALLEGWILARVFKLPKKRCVLVLIAANYFSAWVGALLLPRLFEKYATDIYHGLRVTWYLVGLSYLMTIVLEWPFVAFCLRKTDNWFIRSIKGSLLIQSASYLILFGGYYCLSGTSLYSQMSVVAAENINPPPGIILYFISNEDGDLYRCELGSAENTKVLALRSTNVMDYLNLDASSADTNRLDLLIRNGNHGSSKLPTAFAIVDFSTTDSIPLHEAWGSWQYGRWGQAMRISSATNSSWRFGWAHWNDIGVWGYQKEKRFSIAYGIPFGGWSPRRVVQLPRDQILIQLGDHQICLADLPNKKIAIVRRGYGMLAFQKDQILNLGGATNSMKSGH